LIFYPLICANPREGSDWRKLARINGLTLMTTLNIPTREAIQSARQRLAGTILRTPLVKFENRSDDFSRLGEGTTKVVSTPEIYLKLENLQPTGSFKVRGAGNALLSAEPSELKDGVWTASAGNMGQALAWYAQRLGVACTVIVPDDAPEVKVEAIEQLNAEIVKVPFAEYQAIQCEGGHPDMRGLLIHPFADEAVMVGNGTIGLEILEDLPDVDTILVPYGGGGLSCGIAAAIRASRPGVRVEAVEVATAAPLTRSLAPGNRWKSRTSPALSAVWAHRSSFRRCGRWQVICWMARV
jgi:threonine dehydratase